MNKCCAAEVLMNNQLRLALHHWLVSYTSLGKLVLEVLCIWLVWGLTVLSRNCDYFSLIFFVCGILCILLPNASSGDGYVTSSYSGHTSQCCYSHTTHIKHDFAFWLFTPLKYRNMSQKTTKLCQKCMLCPEMIWICSVLTAAHLCWWRLSHFEHRHNLYLFQKSLFPTCTV